MAVITDDLISRSALLAAYDKAHRGEPGGARKLIEEAPAVDAEPVRHGKWIKSSLGDDDFVTCSCCEGLKLDHRVALNTRLARESWSMNYCAKCGAKMG